MLSWALRVLLFAATSTACEQSLTTVSGTKAPRHVCSGQLIFEDDFEQFDETKWQHLSTLSGGRVSEFQWYVNHPETSFTQNGSLHIRPRLTSDYYDEEFLSSGRVIIPPNECTNSAYNGCDKQGTPDDIINPVRSARIHTYKSFSFKFGTLEIRDKLPAGDWLWPAIWLMPTRNAYGQWPMSGEIDLVESRGNRGLFANDTNVGAEQVAAALNFGPRWDVNAWRTAYFTKHQSPGFNEDFHDYKMVWTNESISFFIDGELLGVVEAGEGFWERGGFETSELPNPWLEGSKMAPFDQQFYLIINVAVGGISFFSDGFRNEGSPKTWWNKSPTPARDFWEGRSNWLPTWNYDLNDDASLQVDYVRIWAL